jgi:glucose-6-phosphate isomerase
MMHISYDDTNMRQNWRSHQARLKTAYAALSKLQQTKQQGWFDLPSDGQMLAMCNKAAKETRARFRRMIVIGIGGSDLGARAIWQALGNPHKGMRLHFVSNPDPDSISKYAHKGSWWKDTALTVVSKSGTTLETVSIFLTLRKALIDSIGKGYGRHITVISDPTGNPLHALAQKHGYRFLPHPQNVGGRFAVLSPVGLFPAACAGIDIRGLLKGAASVVSDHHEHKHRSDAAAFAAQHYEAIRKGKSVHVLMPYSSRLQEFAFWYRQIWAESLGKKNAGPTPIAALGAVDQHSQIQLYNEGPNDKIITFLGVRHFTTHQSVPRIEGKEMEAYHYMSGLSFEKIMHAELAGTAKALKSSGRSNGALWLQKISPESVGALFQFYEIATAYMGQLMRVDAYNQPGVEQGKIEARKLISKVS